MTDEVSDILKPLFGNKCCRVRVGNFKSLSIGFGEKIYHNKPKLIDKFYREWEVGTYNCAWRIMKDDLILVGSTDVANTIEELDAKVNSIHFGYIVSIEQPLPVDVRIEISSRIYVDFLATTSRLDEYFHIFCPNNVYIDLSRNGKWTIDRSDTPFTRK